MIKPAGKDEFRLFTKDGARPLSKKPQTYDEALAQEAAINISKARATGHKVPKRP
jgi:hypothetical protein